MTTVRRPAHPTGFVVPVAALLPRATPLSVLTPSVFLLRRIRWCRSALALSLGSLCIASLARSQVRTGALSGTLSYPGEEIPAMQVVARAQVGGAQTIVRTRAGQRRYRMSLKPGRYVVFAAPLGAGGDEPLRGAHSTYSLCARDEAKRNAGQCLSGTPVEVTVEATRVLERIDIDDWYMSAELMATLRIDGDDDDAEVSFRGYPAGDSAPARPAAPDFTSAPPTARRFQARIRQGAREGARFAGHVAVARWQCGARCEHWALIDLRSGRIVMPESPFQRIGIDVPCVVQPLEYRVDSRLLRVHRRDGARVITQHFLWSKASRTLEPLAEGVMTVDQFCRHRPGTR